MPSTIAKRFGVYALPLLLTLSPAMVHADCQDDSMGFRDALTNIEIDRDTLSAEQLRALQAPNGFNEVVPDLLREAAGAVSAEVLASVIEGREQLLEALDGEKPENMGLPAYPSYEDARDAFLCAMAELRSNRIMYADDRAKYAQLETAFHRLLIMTAVSQNDIQDRLETIRQAEAQGALRSYDHDYSQIDKFAGLLSSAPMIEIIVSEPERLDAYTNFVIDALNNPESDLDRSRLGEALSILVAHNHDYVPQFLDYIADDDYAFNFVLDKFIEHSGTDIFNEDILTLLQDKAENSDDAAIRYLAANRLSRFDAHMNAFEPRGADFYR